jgi:hypothetical protein
MQLREAGRKTVVLLTSRQAAVGGASKAARDPEAPLAPHERVCFAYKVSKAALNRGTLQTLFQGFGRRSCVGEGRAYSREDS